MPRRPIATLLAFAAVLAPLLPPIASQAQTMSCGLPAAAFCDTFDAPSPNGAGTRSGDLDGVVWGVSRSTSSDNVTQKRAFDWNASQLNRCGVMVTVAPPRDVQICNGQVVESSDDGGAVTVLAMYPRQPFDFAGRTGKVVFDVGNDTQGSHMAWPEFVLSDQPVPAPFEDASGVSDFARNSFGVALGADCLNGALVPNGQGDSWSVSSMFTTTNYAFSPRSYAMHGCVKKSTGVGGALNHVEIRMSASHVEVWATDPGQPTLKQIVTADFAMPLTRGLAWMEDIHYNAGKDPGTQGNHTFAWDNFGFDGPILARDLGFDVPDASHDGVSGGSLGYIVQAVGGLSLPITNVRNVAAASAALLEYTWWPHAQATMTIAVNGHLPHLVPWPYAAGAATFKANTMAVPIPLSEIQNGTNTVTFSSTDIASGGVSVANIDLILVGAGGSGVVIIPGGATATPTSTPPPATATATPSPTPTTIGTATSTPTATAPTATALPTSTSIPDTGNPTATPSSTGSGSPPPSGGGGGSSSPPGGSGAGAGGGSPRGGGGGAGVLASIPVPVPVPLFVAPQPLADVAPVPVSTPNPGPAPAQTEPEPALLSIAGAIVGELAPDGSGVTLGNITVAMPGASSTLVVDLIQTDPGTLPAQPDGFQTGDATVHLILNDPSAQQLVQTPTTPITLTYQPTPRDLALAGGDPERLRLAWWDGTAWQALNCQIAGSLACVAARPGMFSVVAAPAASNPLDFEIDGGRLFKQTNGYSGAGSAGFAVTDDADAAMWTEFQRLGGLERVGYPISSRFTYRGFLTQAFQKLVLQWRPDLGLAMPVNVFDDLSENGSDGWLERTQKVPVARTDPQDIGAAWDDVVARHMELLAAYPAVMDFYTSEPDAVDMYGLPLAVKDYGPLVVVRLQRAALQLWTSPLSDAVGEVTIGNGGDMAKDAGLWDPAAANAPVAMAPLP